MLTRSEVYSGVYGRASIRTAFVAQDNRKLLVADFSAIEARVIAWFAGEEWRQEVFAEGKDIYCASASQMFGVPVEKHGINGHTYKIHLPLCTKYGYSP